MSLIPPKEATTTATAKATTTPTAIATTTTTTTTAATTTPKVKALSPPTQSSTDAPNIAVSEPQQDASVKVDTITTTNAETLPPPRTTAGISDYFSGNHGLATETNPFEYSFAGGGSLANGGQVQTPGGTKLPSINALTSPGVSFWPIITGMRSGPLSPAMLGGPPKDDYFGSGHHLRGSFPGVTPNESSLRSGLTPGGPGFTPGGTGTMFPQSSPGFADMVPTTPGGLDFGRAAINARNKIGEMPNITSQPQDPMHDLDSKPRQPPTQLQRSYEESNATDAANGLFLLANANHDPSQTNHYTVAPQTVLQGIAQSMPQMGHSRDSSHTAHQRNGGSNNNQPGRRNSDMSGISEEEQSSRPTTRGKGKRPATQENQPNGNGRRKATDQTPAKAPAGKKSKGNNGNVVNMDEPISDEEPDITKDEYHANGKKMTDDEKRKNFLERNRVAALKCRQRKKQWLQNLQTKVEMYSMENDSLNTTITALRDELVNIKTLLLAHKDCPVSHSQGLSNGGMQQLMEGGYANPHMNPYGMAMGQHPQMMANQAFQQQQQQQQRRES
ncbi:uncharacterized protein L3040_005670 [Drepanopeziza brunnea f. sp. 'multigermtubi']|uniref:BZIP transcription factor n=1 Tax=Marssonina brunnea f. sp. multigermtubi (strain MB_m1) TaxID=1072389 RepID=K1W931_MARBU|nr:bZIP transcription factor [Drepanopeziza brunnea f. sp. 'multigermtubi' MB_m1]EKD13710.1 bZIP transcription factor [Drepanopeziza brunnea f. sp. 'multigermtubi' MB_m1]KAJ5041116.1 hypothetical protein L3040_005670 [Drepanopeziza brunnea f. sp. 'multigermtubi']